MKRILITGKNSYIGTSLEKWLLKEPDKYLVDKISMRDETWTSIDFSKYDVLFHVAGIAHIKETKKNRNLYYKINRDLAYNVAKKAKESGVKQFIFLSSMSVYGKRNGVINKETYLQPSSAYGKSKKEAEELIHILEEDTFVVTTLRPPIVYGRGCSGNYVRLARLAIKTPIFPKVENKRSMIYIDNLTEFVKLLIDYKNGGIYFPQNTDYVDTSEMVRLIAEVHDKKIITTKMLNPFLNFVNKETFNKMFGDLVYEKSMSVYQSNYRICEFRRSIEITEGSL